MSDWRYWITYEGTVSAETEEEARAAANDDHLRWLTEPISLSLLHAPQVEVEEVGEGE